MVMPLFDDNTDRRLFPFVNYALIVVNVLVFVFLQGLGANDRFTYAFSTVPEEIVTGKDITTQDRQIIDPVTRTTVTVPGLQPTPLSVYITLLTSMFMHGGLLHLLGNMLFLWIFGDNVEDSLGHVRYLVFYLVCGVIASLAHVLVTVVLFGANSPQAQVPCLGASGAISGVLGGYLLFHPFRRVTVILFRFLTDVPAYVAIGIWFLFQLINSLGILGPESQVGGVAYGAHIGGFLAGLALVRAFALGIDTDARRSLSGPNWSRRRF
jgi:membrane associated rhomboid family serine protease